MRGHRDGWPGIGGKEEIDEKRGLPPEPKGKGWSDIGGGGVFLKERGG